MALATVLVCSGACSQAPASTPPASTASPVASPDYAAAEREVSQAITTGPEELQQVRAVLVSVRGETVVDLYRRSAPGDHAHVFSVTKSVMSILIGIALDEGRLSSVDQSLGELLPAYRAEMDDRVAATTLRQLLTHTSGLPGNESNSGSLLLDADDTVGQIVAIGPLNDPGAVFEYSNPGAHVLGAVLAEATDRSVLAYARERLFDPLGIETRPAFQGFDAEQPSSRFHQKGFAWAADRQGVNSGCCWLKLTAPDMLKLGQLYLDEGTWRGRRIVSAEWVRQSTSAQVTPEQLGPEGGYGYLWWLGELRGHRLYLASGSFGQLVAVVPDLDVVVAVSSRPTDGPDTIDLRPLVETIVTTIQ